MPNGVRPTDSTFSKIDSMPKDAISSPEQFYVERFPHRLLALYCDIVGGTSNLETRLLMSANKHHNVGGLDVYFSKGIHSFSDDNGKVRLFARTKSTGYLVEAAYGGNTYSAERIAGEFEIKIGGIIAARINPADYSPDKDYHGTAQVLDGLAGVFNSAIDRLNSHGSIVSIYAKLPRLETPRVPVIGG